MNHLCLTQDTSKNKTSKTVNSEEFLQTVVSEDTL